ncbi:MAG TPA: hypothetical protein VK438_19085, partial [Xanthobacteraceae bacterium]|nr:hypothetical protein [Xanthobacteraceae bacterium]
MRTPILALTVAALGFAAQPFATIIAVTPARAQTADRTIEEIKTETLKRAETGAYPTLGIAVDDARAALALINTRDPDEWAAAWSKIAD